MCSEQFSITWNDHPRNVIGVLGRYLDEETLVDCTIAAEGGFLKAHKLVLSACSIYFELLFSQEMKEEKVVVLEDIKFEDLKSLTAFMYDGQVTIPKDRLRDFVRTAEFLQIRGLPSDLLQNSLREATDVSVVCRKEGLASQLSHKRMRCSAISGDSNDLQYVSRISRNQTGEERPSTCMLMDVSEEIVYLQPQSIFESDPNIEVEVFHAEKEPSVEPKEEVDVEDTPVWESEDEDTSAVTDLSSVSVEQVQNELTPVLGTISSRCSFVSSPLVLEKKSETSIAKFRSVSDTILSSTDTASSSPLLSNVPTVQGCVLEDSSLCVQADLAEQSIYVKKKPIVKTEVVSTVVSLHRKRIVEPKLEVWVEGQQSWEAEEVITETDGGDTCHQETTIQDLDVAASCVESQGDKKDVQEVKETKIDAECMGQNCKNVDVNYSTVDKVVECEQCSIIDIDEDNVEKKEHSMGGHVIMVESVETALDGDFAMEQSKAGEDDSAPLSERVSMGKESYRYPGIFCTVSDLRLNVKELHRKDWSNRCEVCMATFAFRSQLKKHKRKHTGERPFLCEVCGKSFSQFAHLSVHKRIHTGERPFQCEVCERSFSHLATYVTHKRIHTGERPFQCEVCENSFSHLATYITHKRIHTGERPFQCNVCTASFCQKTHLTIHKRIHTGERPFQCDVCKRSFGERSKLTQHNRIHTGERPFQCEVCEKSFTHKATLIAHKRIHTGERPFKCELCERSFCHLATYTAHKRVHTGERPFQCNVCTASFSHMATLTTHKRIHSDARPFQCEVCEMSFVLKRQLTKHMRTHTG